jgi:hypothetical protein
MKDFIVSALEDTVINLRDRSGKIIGEVEAVDVVDVFATSRAISKKNGNENEWHLYFQKSFNDLTGVAISKTDAVLLYKHASDLIDELKKSGSDELEVIESSDTPPTTPSET